MLWIVGIWPYENFKITFAIIGGIDGNHFSAKCSNRHAGPTHKLDSWPTLELQTHFVADLDQLQIQPSDIQLDGQIGSVGDDFKEFVPFFNCVRAHLTENGLDAPAAGADYLQSI